MVSCRKTNSPGIAQLVARQLWELDVVRSSRTTRTIWMRSVFRTFLSKNGPLIFWKPCNSRAILFAFFQCSHEKTKNAEEFFSQGRNLNTAFSKNTHLQMLAASYISAFGAVRFHYKMQCTVPRFVENSVPRCTLCSTPLLFWRLQRMFSLCVIVRLACSWERLLCTALLQ